jgi:tetratricopeptide (TPR) repeat protein
MAPSTKPAPETSALGDAPAAPRRITPAPGSAKFVRAEAPLDGARSRKTREMLPAAPVGDRLTVRTTDDGAAIQAMLLEAYDLLQKGQFAPAQQAYERVLAADSRNVDALLGLASVAWQQGQTEKAAEHFYHVLQLDPHNAHAQSGLIGLMGRVDPTASETRLKQLIAREPSGGLYFTLGNLYAGERLWAQAQQAYFQAFQLEPTNPDLAFNLAVGLEHVGQGKLALGYYRKALDLSFARGHAGFDQKQVIQRIGELSATTQ